MFKKLALIGIGLIGSSIARAARKHDLAETIAITTRRPETLDEAKALGLGDIYTLDPREAVRGADLVILCIPVGAYGAVMAEIGDALMPGAILSDVGSVKAHVVKVVRPLVPEGVHFIPAHPIAGTEHSGPAAGFAELFIGRWCILTPEAGVDPVAIDRLSSFWGAMGSDVEVMDARHHDRVLAITSHVPHLIAYNIVGTVADLETATKSEVIKFSASGFRDFTRIAASDPVMWRDVFLTNRDAVLDMLGRFLEDLSKLQRYVRDGDGPAMEELFTRTRAIRRSIITAGQETSAPDFGRPHAMEPTIEPATEPFVDVNVEPDMPVRDHGGGDDA
ncbi:MAG TPA: prephenate/arogenate dehydrogenase family protein [Devosia sp.]|nr:prephenate/arogenate dehydrogenase family protein [Devosia sp.]